jgi:hypothetical protein
VPELRVPHPRLQLHLHLRRMIAALVHPLRWLWMLPLFLFWRLPVLLVWTWPRRGAQAALRVARWLFLGVWRWLCAQGRLLRASPLAFYRMLGRRRDALVVKVEYIHTESAKWRAMWTGLKAPYSALRYFGLSPQMAIGLLALGGTAGGGVVINETLLSERSFSRGDSGVYSAPADVPTSYSEGNNTLLVQLGAVPVGSIVISAIDLATSYANSTLPSGQTNAIEIGGSAALSNYLEIGHLIIDRWRCETFRMEHTEAHTLEITGSVADGLSISPVPGVVRKRAVGGGLRAESMSVANSTYDQIRITAPTNAVNGQVDVLRISNLATRGGGCLISRVKAGTITIEYLTVGAGNGLSLKDLVVATSTTYSVANISENVEELVSPLPAP